MEILLALDCKKNKGADRLGRYRAANLRLCLRICRSRFSDDAANNIDPTWESNLQILGRCLSQKTKRANFITFYLNLARNTSI